MIEDIMQEYAQNLKVFTSMKKDHIETNYKSFIDIYWLINKTISESDRGHQIRPEDREAISSVLRLGYLAGYNDALK